jgi:predicted lipoprotein with Yx(FWY)xxD motif
MIRKNRGMTGVAAAGAVAALAAGCSSSGTTSSSSSTAPTTAASSGATGGSTGGATAGGATLKTASSPDGQIVVDGSGRSLYLFQADTGSTSTCNGACAVAWPPDHTTGAPVTNGLTASLAGTTTRGDKSTQVTFHGHPLYYFAQDTKAGDIKGQGLTAFGGAWYLVDPDGSAVTSMGGSPSTSGGYSGY